VTLRGQNLPADLLILFQNNTEQRRNALKYFHEGPWLVVRKVLLKDFLVAGRQFVGGFAPENSADIQEGNSS